MLDKSLLVCYSTPNYSNLTQIFLNSLNLVGIQNIKHLIEKPNEEITKEAGFQTDLWYFCVRNKIEYLINVLTENCINNYYDFFIFSDCDIYFYTKNKSEWYVLEKMINNSKNDIFFMREEDSNDVNSGFFIIKNNESIQNLINFFKEVIQIMDQTAKNNMPFGDQSIINLLKDKIKYDYIPNEFVVFGSKIYNKNKTLFHHAVGCKNVEEKIVQINYIKSVIES